MACDKQLLLRNAWLRAQTIGRVHYAAQTHALRCGGVGDAALSDAAGSEAVPVDGALLAHDLDELIVLGVAFEVGRALLHEASDSLLRSRPTRDVQ